MANGLKLTRGNKVFIGFKNGDTPFYKELPGVICITGQQNVGKSVTACVLIAAMHRAKVNLTICDIHATKERSLSKKIYPLAPWLTTASTPADVATQVERMRSELATRKQYGGGEPRCIVIDELAATMRSSDEVRERITLAIKELAQEGHGYGLFMVVIAHDVTKEGLGDGQFRSFFNWVLCHRSDANQTKYLQFSGKAQTAAQKLEAGQVLMRDEVYDFHFLTIPEYGWKEMLIVAENSRRAGVDTIHHIFELENTPYSVDGKLHSELTAPLEPIGDTGMSTIEAWLTLVDGQRTTKVDTLKEADIAAFKLALSACVNRKELWKMLKWHSRKYDQFEAMCEHLGL